MASNADLQKIVVGAWEFELDGTSLLFLQDEDVEIAVNRNLIIANEMLSGKTPGKVFEGADDVSVKMTLNHENLATLQSIYSRTANSYGGIDFVGQPGRIITPKSLKGWCHHWVDSTKYGKSELNPLGIWLYRSFADGDMTWLFNTSETSNREITFRGQADYSKNLNSPGRFGFIPA